MGLAETSDCLCEICIQKEVDLFLLLLHNTYITQQGVYMDPEDFEDSDFMDLDSPTDFDEYEMNPDDCAPDARDPFDMEYDI